MEKASGRNAWISAGFAVVTAPVAAGVMALVWKFPIALVGIGGGDVNSVYAAALTMVAFMTLFSFFIGFFVIGLAGAGAGVLVRHGPTLDAVTTGVAVGVVAALVVGFAGAFFGN
ncbi:hypothetical protein ABIE38_003520 [Dietzia sp. 2505]|uniref:hypothetical protein n=1 Tax=unclassified Dietzia TaxID=2617939 RepID=UPI0015FA8F3C|nr:hypothetical protein [Dietzia sp. B44]MBB1055682.1 hypothetical protein [Dietzia sp. B44]